jgi:hypothetical protein
MLRWRRRLISLVVAFPLFLIAFVLWLIADEPLVSMDPVVTGKSMPLWWGAGLVIRACLPAVVLGLILGALVVAVLRSRRRRTWASAGDLVAAAVVVIGPAFGITGLRDAPSAHPGLDQLALVLGLLAAIAILANAAAREPADRRTARLIVLPAAMLCIVLLAVSVALVVYAIDLVVNGVPMFDPTLGLHVYPVDALPAGYAGWLPALIVSVAASLAALAVAAYGMVGPIRGARLKAMPAVDIVIDLDIAPG